MSLAPRAPLPFYFGPAHKQLFGCYHEPRTEKSRDCAVVICQPFGHEYINCHRALRQLAVRISDAGFPVLRFDYYGCGDSSGNAEQGGISQWLQDISSAICEVRARANVRQVCLVGLRLGAALSMTVAVEREDIDSLVLWDAVVNGKTYLENLTSLQKEMLRFRPKPVRHSSQAYREILGFPMSHFLYTELEKMNLIAVEGKPAKQILAIQSHKHGWDVAFKDRLNEIGARCEYQYVQAPEIWLPKEDGSLLVPSQILQSITAWANKHLS
jgi:alpha/beta superfamily hydrolase